MTEIIEIDRVINICRSLSNKKRLKLILLLKNGQPMTLRELYGLSREYINLQHRETLYKYLESLVEAGLVKKVVSSDGNNEYILAEKGITINFQQLEVD